MKPTITHITAADGSHLTITTRIAEAGVLAIRVFRGPERNHTPPVMAGDFATQAGAEAR